MAATLHSRPLRMRDHLALLQPRDNRDRLIARMQRELGRKGKRINQLQCINRILRMNLRRAGVVRWGRAKEIT